MISEDATPISQGTNVLAWNDTRKIINETFKALDGAVKKGNCPELWDGHSAERIVKILAKRLIGRLKGEGLKF